MSNSNYYWTKKDRPYFIILVPIVLFVSNILFLLLLKEQDLIEVINDDLKVYGFALITTLLSLALGCLITGLYFLITRLS